MARIITSRLQHLDPMARGGEQVVTQGGPKFAKRGLFGGDMDIGELSQAIGAGQKAFNLAEDVYTGLAKPIYEYFAQPGAPKKSGLTEALGKMSGGQAGTQAGVRQSAAQGMLGPTKVYDLGETRVQDVVDLGTTRLQETADLGSTTVGPSKAQQSRDRETFASLREMSEEVIAPLYAKYRVEPGDKEGLANALKRAEEFARSKIQEGVPEGTALKQVMDDKNTFIRSLRGSQTPDYLRLDPFSNLRSFEKTAGEMDRIRARQVAARAAASGTQQQEQLTEMVNRASMLQNRGDKNQALGIYQQVLNQISTDNPLYAPVVEMLKQAEAIGAEEEDLTEIATTARIAETQGDVQQAMLGYQKFLQQAQPSHPSYGMVVERLSGAGMLDQRARQPQRPAAMPVSATGARTGPLAGPVSRARSEQIMQQRAQRVSPQQRPQPQEGSAQGAVLGRVSPQDFEVIKRSFKVAYPDLSDEQVESLALRAAMEQESIAEGPRDPRMRQLLDNPMALKDVELTMQDIRVLAENARPDQFPVLSELVVRTMNEQAMPLSVIGQEDYDKALKEIYSIIPGVSKPKGIKFKMGDVASIRQTGAQTKKIAETARAQEIKNLKAEARKSATKSIGRLSKYIDVTYIDGQAQFMTDESQADSDNLSIDKRRKVQRQVDRLNKSKVRSGIINKAKSLEASQRKMTAKEQRRFEKLEQRKLDNDTKLDSLMKQSSEAKDDAERARIKKQITQAEDTRKNLERRLKKAAIRSQPQGQPDVSTDEFEAKLE